MVRATAVAVTGSLEGVLMMASEREIAFQTIVCTLIPGALPAITCTHRAPKARRRILLPDRTPRGCSTHPSRRSEEHTSELQSLMRISYAVFCLKKKKKNKTTHDTA